MNVQPALFTDAPDKTAFEPTMAAARSRLAAVRVADYARSRNAIEGAVSRLSPYITHGFLTLQQVLAALAARQRIGAAPACPGIAALASARR